MGWKYKTGTCKRCDFEGYVNDHHIVPKCVKRKDNKDTVRLCLNCHVALHELLPDEPQDEDFYKEFTEKWIEDYRKSKK